MSTVFKLIPTTQQYEWGKIGLASKVAQYAAASKLPGFSLDENGPYAELWMGTHPKSPTLLRDASSQEKLSDHLAAHPELVGPSVIERFKGEGAKEGNLPFLFKILAIGKALSIQTHPSKEQAVKLHAEQPDIYKDANHKPEMALALTPFEAMCGFLPLARIADYIVDTPEFAALVPQTIREQFLSIASSPEETGPAEKHALKELFSAVMTAEASIFQPELEKLVARYKGGGASAAEDKDLQELVCRLSEQYPGDIGVFCAFMLHYLILKPGEAIFLAAGEPHAYVDGDIVECMATSDNVIRAGLTPKLRDVPNLVAGLTYNPAPASNHFVEPRSFASAQHTTLYDPPIEEFSVLRAVVPAGETEVHPPLDGPSIAIVTEGSGDIVWGSREQLNVVQGEVLFIGAGQEVRLEAAKGQGPLVVHRAFVEAK